jgi:hypothetical protein
MKQWDNENRRQFELQCYLDSMIWMMDSARAQDGLFVFLARLAVLPLYYYHQTIYLRILTVCGFVAWRVNKAFNYGGADISGNIHFKIAIDIYNLAWNAVLIACYVLAFVFARAACEELTLQVVLVQASTAILAFFRLYEILGVTIRLHIKDSYHTNSKVRAFVNTLWHYFFVAVIFAIFYMNTATLVPDGFGDKPLTVDIVSPLYFSIVTLATIGYGDFHPESPFGKTLVCIEVLIGLLLVVLVIARVVAMMSTQKEQK